jgi:hypothetical protein
MSRSADYTEKPVKKFNIEINPVKMKEIISTELQTKAVEAIQNRKAVVAKTVFNTEGE